MSDVDTSFTNWNILAGKAAAAIANNQAFLALASPTAVQVAAQVAALTRQQTALIRVQLGHLDTTDGT